MAGTCKVCKREFKRSYCEYCKRESKWDEAKHLRSFTPRIRNDLSNLIISINESEVDSLRRGNGLLLVGNTGCGKTLYAAKLLLESAHRAYVEHIPPRMHKFISVPDLMDEIRASYNNPEEDTIYEYMNVDFLVLDDLGVEKVNDWVREKIYQLINYRYEYQLATVYTSNLNGSELSDRLGDRVVGRIQQMCTIKKMKKINYRIHDRK